MTKLWTIALKDIRNRFTDRTLLIIMIAAPLIISTIIGLAFGGLGRTSSPISNIPVAVINNDQPDANGTSYGSFLAGLLINGQLPAGTSTSLADCPKNTSQAGNGGPAGGQTLAELVHGTVFDETVAQNLVTEKSITAPPWIFGSPDFLSSAAKAAVDKDVFAAVVIIPANFSASLTSLADPRKPQVTSNVSVYGNAGQGLSAGIVRSIVDSITAQLVSGNIAIGATINEISARNPAALAGASSQKLGDLLVCAFAPGNNLAQMVEKPVQASATSTAGTILVTFGSAQALFFAMFTGQNGILSMYEERKNWTLQRIIVSPTPRWAILGGKLVGVLVSVIFQLITLVIALTIVASIIEGHPTFIWGTDIVKLGLVLLAVAVAVSGIGMMLAGVLKGIEQASIVGSVLNIALGVLGGAFGFQLPRSVAAISLIYWARNAFDMLASGRGDISLNLLVLFVEGAVTFVIGLILFSRKFEA